MVATLELFELGGQGGKHYSLFSWRTRMALAHKGLAFDSRPVKVSDKAAIAFSGQKRVPILRHGETTVFDSWKIAEYLETNFPAAPSLFGGEAGHALSRFVNGWVDRVMVPSLAPNIALSITECLDEDDAAHIRVGFETAFGKTLEQLHEERAKGLQRFRQILEPLRAVLKWQPFLGGAQPLYADYVAFSPLQWARVVCADEVVEKDDFVGAWFERVLDLHDGFARKEPPRG